MFLSLFKKRRKPQSKVGALILASTVIGASLAEAGTISCRYTEPFVSTEYNIETSTLVVRDDAGEKVLRTIENVTLKAFGVETLLVSNSGEVLQRLVRTGQGSDGMSDRIFPFDGYVGSSVGLPKLVGGCETDKLRSHNPNL